MAPTYSQCENNYVLKSLQCWRWSGSMVKLSLFPALCHPEAGVGFQGCSWDGKWILGHWAAPGVAGRIALDFQHLGDL